MTERLGKRLADLLDSTEPFGGRGGRAAFIALLETKHGIRIGQSTLYSWLSGARTPELEKLRVVLDMLGVHGDERDDLVRLALPDGLLTSANRPDTENAA